MENPYEAEPQENLLTDFEVNLQQASQGKRLANYLIDIFTFYVFLFILSFILPQRFLLAPLISQSGFQVIYGRLLILFLYGLFMACVEAACKGKSLGKLITRTRAVNEDGTPIAPRTAFIRGLSRAVPFDNFSALGSPSYPWHDKWSHTYVIDETLSTVAS